MSGRLTTQRRWSWLCNKCGRNKFITSDPDRTWCDDCLGTVSRRCYRCRKRRFVSTDHNRIWCDVCLAKAIESAERKAREPRNPVYDLIHELGGVAAVSTALDLSPRAGRIWHQTGIPPKHIGALLKLIERRLHRRMSWIELERLNAEAREAYAASLQQEEDEKSAA